MSDQSSDPVRPSWHALLAPLPPEAVPERKPVGSPEQLASPAGSPIAGWEQLSVNLSAGGAGLRAVLVVLDATGTLLSASDAVLYRAGHDGRATILQLSVGGRFEPDGSFHGTRWHSVAFERGGHEEPEWESTPSSPSEEDVEALRAVVSDVLRRGEAGVRSRESGNR
jgi:hypothetical protein